MRPRLGQAFRSMEKLIQPNPDSPTWMFHVMSLRWSPMESSISWRRWTVGWWCLYQHWQQRIKADTCVLTPRTHSGMTILRLRLFAMFSWYYSHNTFFSVLRYILQGIGGVDSSNWSLVWPSFTFHIRKSIGKLDGRSLTTLIILLVCSTCRFFSLSWWGFLFISAIM